MKNLDNKIKDSKEYIETKTETNSSYIYQKAMANENEKPSFIVRNLKIIKFASLILVLGAMFTAGFFISKAVNKPSERQTTIYESIETDNVKVKFEKSVVAKAPSNFSNFVTKDDLVTYLTSNKANVVSNYSSFSSDLIIAAEAPTSSVPSNIEYKTNTQLENVDEADIVKVCDKHIFFLPNVSNKEDKKLYVLTEENNELYTSFVIDYAKNEEILKEYDEYNLVSITTQTPQDLYVTDKYVVVRISKNSYKCLKQKSLDDISLPTYYNRYDNANTCVFQILDINTLNLVTTIETAGSNVSTRLIGNDLYVINNYVDYLNNDNKYYYYPYLFIDSISYLPLVDNIYYDKNNNSEVLSYVSVYKITLDDEITISDLHVITPTTNKIYSSEKNIYLIRNYNYENKYEEEYQISYVSSNVTVINIENGLSLSGSFVVKGNINDKYWIDEKDDYIRIVTTGNETKNYYLDQRYVYKKESKIFNCLSIFKKTNEGYILSSSITEGLGKPGENVRSARFNGDVVTIVTYQNTDPLYYVDISDPNNPVITSSLEITGYGVYQHPYKDKYVISFGYEDGSHAYKITLFDVSDKENIKQVGNPYILVRWKNEITKDNLNLYYNANVDFLSNPKSLFVNEELGMFGFRLSGNEETNLKCDYIATYFILTIDEDSNDPIKLTSIADFRYNRRKADEYSLKPIYETEYQRLVFIGTNYYLLSEDNVICYKLENGKLVRTNVLDITLQHLNNNLIQIE